MERARLGKEGGRRGRREGRVSSRRSRREEQGGDKHTVSGDIARGPVPLRATGWRGQCVLRRPGGGRTHLVRRAPAPDKAVSRRVDLAATRPEQRDRVGKVQAVLPPKDPHRGQRSRVGEDDTPCQAHPPSGLHDCLLTSARPLDRSQLHPFKAVGAAAARGELAVSWGVPARRGGCALAPPPRGMTTGERGGAVKELDDDSSGGRRTTSRG